MHGWWTELPSWLRVGLGLMVLLTGVGILWAGMTGHIIEHTRVCPRISLVLIGVGLAMILIGGKSESERKGYRF